MKGGKINPKKLKIDLLQTLGEGHDYHQLDQDKITRITTKYLKDNKNLSAIKVTYDKINLVKASFKFNGAVKITKEEYNEFMKQEPQWFKNFTKIYQADQERQQAFNQQQIAFNKSISKDILNINKDISNMKNDISDIKKDINAMKNTPTMKRELANNS